jgi:hypothetical protein
MGMKAKFIFKHFSSVNRCGLSVQCPYFDWPTVHITDPLCCGIRLQIQMSILGYKKSFIVSISFCIPGTGIPVTF